MRIPAQFHPLDPLGADEFRAAATLLADAKGVTFPAWRLAAIELIEPDKAAVEAFEAAPDGAAPDGAAPDGAAPDGAAPDRIVGVNCFERSSNNTYQARLSLTRGVVISFTHIPGVQANMTVDEWEEADEALRSHPRVIAALAKRGITDLSLVFMDVWTYGLMMIPERYQGRRIGWSDTWVRARSGANPYAGPVNGFHCIIDLATMELLDVEDTFAVDPPEIMGEYVPAMIPERLRNASTREPVKPLEIAQPDGVSFRFDGNRISWQNWSMRIGFNYREGLTLHRVSYRDAGRERPIANRLSFAEMAVPYRDPSEDHYRRTAFDVGEWGLGFMTTSLELGCDCLGEVRYLDAVMHNSAGEPYTIKNAICVHEEDAAVLWKHMDHDGSVEVRRMRRLVVSFHVTVANYEYLVYWRFYQDGNIECEVRATGIMVVSYFAEGQEHPSGTLVDNRTYAPFHQHFLVARLDLDIDGTANTVYRSETEMVPMGPDNPYGLALHQKKTPITTEGHDDYSWETQRTWAVTNDNSANGLGTRVSYKLVPGASFPSFFDPASPVFQRAEVVGHTVWVTPNDPDERWPAGEFVNQGAGGLGMPEWVRQGRSVENTDVVVWYVFGIHHIPRPEEWPVMPVDTVAFWLKPVGFFDRNPALDVEPAPEADECH